MHTPFERCEIEEIDPATSPGLIIDRVPEKRTRRKAPLDLEPDGTTDGLQPFLKGISKVRLLSAREAAQSGESVGSRLSSAPGGKRA